MEKGTGIFRQTTTVVFLTLMIKVLGFVKQAVLAAVYGATVETDALYISSGVINALCNVVFSAISISLLSMYAKKIVEEGREEARRLIDRTLCIFVPMALVLTVVFFAGAPLVARFFAPSYQGRVLEMLVSDVRILSVSFLFWSYFLILNVVAEADKRFIPGKGYSLFQNVFVIAAALLFPHVEDVRFLPYAFVLAGAVQCVYITFAVRRSYTPHLRLQRGDQEIRQLLQLVVPLLIGNAIYEINDIVDKQICSGLGSGTVSVLTYGASVNEIVTSLIITSVSTVLFAHFATWVAEGKLTEVYDHLKNANECLAAITFPATAMCVICGSHIVLILFGRGNFDEVAVRMTSGVVAAYGLGFFFQAMRANLVKVFYAFGDTRRPMVNGAICVACNICMSLVFSRFFSTAGIALATSLSMLLATILLGVQVRRYLTEFRLLESGREYLKVLAAALVAAAALLLLQRSVQMHMYLLFLLESAVFVLVYGGVLLALRARVIVILRRMLVRN